MRGIVVLAVGVAAAVLTAPAASADNQSYLNAVSGPLSSPDGASGLLRAGKGACAMLAPNSYLMFGRNPNWVAQMVWEQNPTLERDQATFLVNAAIDNLCPGVNMLGHAG